MGWQWRTRRELIDDVVLPGFRHEGRQPPKARRLSSAVQMALMELAGAGLMAVSRGPGRPLRYCRRVVADDTGNVIVLRRRRQAPVMTGTSPEAV